MPAGTELSETHSCFSVAEPELEPELELELELESEQDQIIVGWSMIFIEIEPALGFSKTNFKVPASFVLMSGIV